jgi:hypothetical protein
LVECDLAKVDVAGSNPVSRSRFRLVPAVRAAQRSSVVNLREVVCPSAKSAVPEKRVGT